MSAASSGVAACSSAKGTGFNTVLDDGGESDGAHGDDATVTPHSDSGDDGNGLDAGAQPDTAQPEGGPTVHGHCGPVQGPECDLVEQQCPSVNGTAQECVVTQASDGGITTGCSPVQSSQHLDKGHGCCPSAQSNQCNPGLECIGDPNAACDGGVLPGRCSPHCCGGDAGDDSLCGASYPEGIAGHCDLIISESGGHELFTACSYDEVCKPFHIKPCGANSTCIVKDPSGTAGCYPIFNPDGGPASQEGQPCAAANSCADGLVCLGSGAVGTCKMMCYKPGGNPPFDAGSLDGGPFYGGCSQGKTCNTQVTGPDGGPAFPPWLWICGP